MTYDEYTSLYETMRSNGEPEWKIEKVYKQEQKESFDRMKPIIDKAQDEIRSSITQRCLNIEPNS